VLIETDSDPGLFDAVLEKASKPAIERGLVIEFTARRLSSSSNWAGAAPGGTAASISTGTP
jgi:hypothetical protein